MKKSVKKHYNRLNSILKGSASSQPNPTKIAKSLSKLYSYDTGLFFANLAKIPINELAFVLLEMSGELLEVALSRLAHQKVAAAVAHLESDEATDFMQRLRQYNESYAQQLYHLLKPHEQRDITRLSSYSSDQAGAYMQTELLSAQLHENVADVKKKIRRFRSEEPTSPIIKLFVIDEEHRLITTIHFSDLILFEENQSIESVIAELKPHRPLTIRPTSPVEEVLRLFDEYDLSMVGVVDKEGVLQGRIVYDDVYELIRDIETDHAYKMVGLDDEAEEESLQSAYRKRLVWLFVNLGTILMASFVIGQFDELIVSYVALAILMPVVAALGGNTGMQALTVTIRRLALGEIDYASVHSVFKREAFIALVNGTVMAAAVSAVSYIWFSNPKLALAVALAVFSNLMVAGSVGALIPLGLKKIGIDPAVASSVLLTTTADVFGFFIFLFMAQMILA